MSFNSQNSSSISTNNSQVFDFDGLEESLVDNELNEEQNEEIINELKEDSNYISFNIIRESLIRDQLLRTKEDLLIIDKFLSFIAKNNSIFLLKTRKELSKHLVLAEIESRDTRVLTNGETLDAYCIVAFGSLRHVYYDDEEEEEEEDGDLLLNDHHDYQHSNGQRRSIKTRYLCVGDEFGASIDDRIVHGDIYTNEDFVWVLCVPHLIFDQICGEKTFKTIRNELNGNIIEIRNYGNELIRATRDRLFELLFKETTEEDDDIYISDFLLTFRLWASRDCHEKNGTNHELMQKIISNLKQEKNLEKNIKIVLNWISFHFQDFQKNSLLKEFEMNLKSKIHKKLFYLALSSKSRERQVTITRSERTSQLPFTLIGGYECSSRLFISDVQNDCDADLSRGDRLISINGIDCHVMEVSRALDLCKSCTHLSLILKFDPNLYQLLIDGQISRNSETKRHLNELKSTITQSSFTKTNQLSSQSLSSSLMSTNNNWKQKVRQIVQNVTTNNKLSSINNNNNNNTQVMNTTTATTTTTQHMSSSETPEVIKIYYDSDFRYLPIHVTTTARECIQLALIEFQLNTSYSSRDFALYEYKLIDKTTATSAVKRISDNYQNLAKNLSLNSRIYLKCISNGNQLSETEITREITRESHLNSLLTLDSDIIAKELFSRDFELFCRIESQQFVYDLKEENYSIKELKEFEEKTNLEMFWTINQILNEKIEKKRTKIIKQLIRIALICKELQNFNTLFAILSGLQHLSINRLKMWEKIPQKSIQKLEKLQQLMDPSRNFHYFRQKLRQLIPPIIPFFPLVKKDLSFIYLANENFISIENQLLINWEKMKLLSQKIREIQTMTHNSQQLATNNENSINYKKIWEKQRMKKRVQHFLDKSFSEIISDENILFVKSLECEPTQTSSQMTRSSISASSVASQQSTTSSNVSIQQHVMPSPTPSSHSSSPSLSSSTTNSSDIQSSSRLRFGVRDDNGLRKLLALSDNCVNTTNQISFATNNHFLSHFPSQQTTRVAVVSASKSLPQESSSVTSLRRLEQLQQLSRFRDQLLPQTIQDRQRSRPLLPSYDQTIQRMKKKSLNNEENIV